MASKKSDKLLAEEYELCTNEYQLFTAESNPLHNSGNTFATELSLPGDEYYISGSDAGQRSRQVSFLSTKVQQTRFKRKINARVE